MRVLFVRSVVLRLTLALLVLVVAGCGGDSTGPGEDGITATFAFTASGDVEQSYQVNRTYTSQTFAFDPTEEHAFATGFSGSFIVVGMFNDRGSAIDHFGFFLPITGPGTFTACGDGYPDACVDEAGIDMGWDLATDTYTHQYEMVDAMVTVTELSDTRIRGTFEADLVRQDATDGTATLFLRNGSFDVPRLTPGTSGG